MISAAPATAVESAAPATMESPAATAAVSAAAVLCECNTRTERYRDRHRTRQD
jgi:hypothetical protein